MSSLQIFFGTVEENTQGNIAEFWQNLNKEDKEKWLKVINDAPVFQDIKIDLDLSTRSHKDFGYFEGELPEIKMGEKHLITYRDAENFTLCSTTLTWTDTGWSITLDGIDYPIQKKENSHYLFYIPKVLEILQQLYSQYKDKDIHLYLREKNITKLIALINDDINTLEKLSDIEMIDLFTLIDGSSRHFLYQLILKIRRAEDLEKLVDKAKRILPATVYNQLISSREKGQETPLLAVSKKFPEHEASSLRIKLTPQVSQVQNKAETNTHQTSIHISVDVSLIKVFKRFAQEHSIGSNNYTIYQQNNRREILINSDKLLKPTKKLLDTLEANINKLLLQKNQSILDALNGEQGSEKLYTAQDVELFKKNLAVANRFVKAIIKGKPFGSEMIIEPHIINPIGLTLQHIVAISYWATINPKHQQNTIKNFLHYVKHLKEIMREYNINEYGQTDLNKCQTGSINHLVKALDGIDPDVTVAYVTDENIHDEINECWHYFLIEKMKKEPELVQWIIKSLLDNWEKQQLVCNYFSEFELIASPHLERSYHHILLDKGLYAKALQNPKALNSVITLGITRDQSLMRQFNSFYNNRNLLQTIELETYLDLLHRNKAPYYIPHSEDSRDSFIESIIKTRTISPKDALVCFKKLDGSFNLLLLNVFVRCFDKERVIITLLESMNFEILRQFDPSLKITQAILDQNKGPENYINCFIACISKDYQLAVLLLKLLKPEDINAPVQQKKYDGSVHQEYLLSSAIQNNAIHVVKALLDRQADIHAVNQNAHSFLKYYCQYNNVMKHIPVSRLFELGIDKRELIKQALIHSRLDILRDADSPAFSETQQLQLHHNRSLFNLALSEGDAVLACIFLKEIYVNEPCETRKYTKEEYYDMYHFHNKIIIVPTKYPLHRAIELKNIKLIHALIAAGASCEVLTEEKQTPLDLAFDVGLNVYEAFPQEFIDKMISNLLINKEYARLLRIDPNFDRIRHLDKRFPSLDDLIIAADQSAWRVVEKLIQSMPEKFHVKLDDLQIQTVNTALFNLIHCHGVNKINAINMITFFSQIGLRLDEYFMDKVICHNDRYLLADKTLMTVVLDQHNGCLKKERLRNKLYSILINHNNIDAIKHLLALSGDNSLPQMNLDLNKLDIQAIDYLFDSGYLQFQQGGTYCFKRSQPQSYDSLFVIKTTQSENLKVFRSLCDHGLDIYSFKYKDKTLLMHLAQVTSGNYQIYESLLIEVISRSQSHSSRDNHYSFFSLFKKPYINLKDKQGLCALDYAIQTGNSLAINTLLAHGAIPNAEARASMIDKRINVF